MPKNLVLCCDGTANEFAEDRTNVVKLFFTLERDPSRQLGYYHPGLGTMEPPGDAHERHTHAHASCCPGIWLSARSGYPRRVRFPDEQFRGRRSSLPFRVQPRCLYGASRCFLAPHVRFDSERQRSACALCDPHADGDKHNRQQERQSQRGREALLQSGCRFQKYFLDADLQALVCRRMGYGKLDWLVRKSAAPAVYKQQSRHRDWPPCHRHRRTTRLLPDKSLDAMDCPSQSGPRDLKQVWFPGVHGDVGGGYPEAESGLSKIALQWMLNEAINAGLLVSPGRMDLVLGKTGAYAAPDANAMMHESLTGLWWLAEILWKRRYNWVKRQWERRANLGRRRTIPPGSLIHESAYKRGGDYAKRLPPDAIPTR